MTGVCLGVPLGPRLALLPGVEAARVHEQRERSRIHHLQMHEPLGIPRHKVAMTPDLDRMPNALPLHVTPKGETWEHRVCGGIEVAPPLPSY